MTSKSPIELVLGFGALLLLARDTHRAWRTDDRSHYERRINPRSGT
jgi:hypothetical protein